MDNKTYICKYCGKEFETSQKLGGHVSKCKLNPNYNNTLNKINETKKSKYNVKIIKCEVCGNTFELSLTDKQFNKGKYRKTCSSKCSHKLSTIKCNNEIRSNKISNSNKNKYYGTYKTYICQYCGKEFTKLDNNSTIYCSNDCKLSGRHNKLSKLAKENNFGGYTENSIKKHKHGTYKGIHYDSSWELAYIIYNLEHNIEINRCTEFRTYIDNNGNEKRYLPDFIVNNDTIEIKGYFSDIAQLKQKYNPDIKVLLYNDIKFYLDYAKEKYGDDFWNNVK